MRNVFADAQDYADENAVKDEYSWAAEIIEVEGGWMVFESADDAETWKNQQ